jgi:hypothetical protein
MASQYFGKSDQSPSDLVLALGIAERIRDLVTKSAPGLVPPHKQVGASYTRDDSSRLVRDKYLTLVALFPGSHFLPGCS